MTACTEKEAAERWCPFARVEGDSSRSSAAGNRWDTGGGSEIEKYGPMENPKAARCIGSRCMAWRWKTNTVCRRIKASGLARVIRDGRHQEIAATNLMEGDAIPARPENVPVSWVWEFMDKDEDTDAGWREPVSEAEQRRRGYCGLAGAP